MRCGCPECGAFMVNSDGPSMGCVCPQCGFRCRDCLGTNTVISRDAIRSLKQTQWHVPSFDSEVPGEEYDAPEDPRDPSERP